MTDLDAEAPTAPAPDDPTLGTSGPPDGLPDPFAPLDHALAEAFGHGQAHGRLKAAFRPDAYADCVGARADAAAQTREAGEARRAHAEAEAALGLLTDLQQREAFDAAHVRAAEGRLGRADGALSEARREQAEADDAPRALKGRGHRTYAALFGLAGAVFIVGDVALAKETVGKGLRIDGWEGWAFAIGMASLAFLLKPAYDRLVEDVWAEGRRRAFTGFILATAVLTFATLYYLGAYRVDYFRAHAAEGVLASQEEALAQDRSRLDRQARIAGEESPEIAAGREVLTAREQALAAERQAVVADRDQSENARWALILSQILFAVAGAVCFGIAFRHGLDHYHLWRPARARIRDAAEGVRLTEAARDAAEAALAERQAHGAALRTDLASRPEASVLRAQAESARAEESAALRARDEALRRYHVALYRAGFALGLHLPEAPPARPRRERARLYLALREAVRSAAMTQPAGPTPDPPVWPPAPEPPVDLA